MLTRKQHDLLMFIHERLKETGVPPSFEEMKEALDLRSKSGIHRLITALEERGFIRRLPHRARALEIVKLPESVAPGLASKARGFNPSVIEGSLGRMRTQPEPDGGETPHATVPVLQLDDGTCLSDSISICQYLDETYPEPNLMGRDPKEKAVIGLWQRDVELNGFMSIAECFRNRSRGFINRALTGPVNYAQIPELVERGRQRVKHFYQSMDLRLAEVEYIAGDRFSIADISMLVMADFAHAIKEPIPEDAANLQRWYANVSARPGSVA